VKKFRFTQWTHSASSCRTPATLNPQSSRKQGRKKDVPGKDKGKPTNNKSSFCTGHDVSVCRKKLAAEAKNPPSAEAPTDKQQIRCYGCGQPGVIYRNCQNCSKRTELTHRQHPHRGSPRHCCRIFWCPHQPRRTRSCHTDWHRFREERWPGNRLQKQQIPLPREPPRSLSIHPEGKATLLTNVASKLPTPRQTPEGSRKCRNHTGSGR
jgi:hypothetical protein